MASVFLDNDHVVNLIGLQDIDDNYDNTATVTVTVVDTTGTEIDGAAWPISMSYIAASNGDYRGTIPAAIEFVASQIYNAKISVVGTGAEIGLFNLSLTGVVRV